MTTPPPSQASPTPWDGKPSVGSGDGTANDNHKFTPPPVPSNEGPGTGTTSVDTPSMTVFASNIDLLIKPVTDAKAALQPVTLATGAFYHAYQIHSGVTGPNDDAGIKGPYLKALTDLLDGLTDLSDGVKTLAKKYTTIEDANNMKAQDLKDAMSKSTGDLNQMMQDGGGTGTNQNSGGPGDSTGGDSTGGDNTGGGNNSGGNNSGGNNSGGNNSGGNKSGG